MKHGYARRNNKHLLSYVRTGMLQRCTNPNHDAYRNYGERGISVCKEWINDVGLFIRWSLNNGWSKGLDIDRIDNDGNYCPENCRFVTRKENVKDKRKYRNNKSGYTGVSKHGDNWQVDVGQNYVGIYSNKIDAAVARDSYVINHKLGFRLNFLQPITEIR